MILKDISVPRTIFYELAINAIKRIPGYQLNEGEILIPEEDTAEETNWPRFGKPASAYIKPLKKETAKDKIPVEIALKTSEYINKAAQYSGKNYKNKFLIMNMNPERRLPLAFCHRKNVIVADGNLAQHERQLNKNTISLPALPLVGSNTSPIPAEDRVVKASFQGEISHNCRRELIKLNKSDRIIINNRSRSNYSGKIDALGNEYDQEYIDLLDNSTFGIVARGDALFSYRLLETIARGAIPIIISDGWILPFDRTINWESCSLRFHQEGIFDIPFFIDKIEKIELKKLQENSIRNYNLYFKDLYSIMKTMLNEALVITNKLN